MVLSLYFSKLFVTNRSTIDDLPTPVSPSKTTFTSRGACGKSGRGAAAVAAAEESGAQPQRRAS